MFLWQGGVYTNTVVVQRHSVVMTKTDKIYKVNKYSSVMIYHVRRLLKLNVFLATGALRNSGKCLLQIWFHKRQVARLLSTNV